MDDTVAKGSGIVDGLVFVFDTRTKLFQLKDTSPDGRFAEDVALWNICDHSPGLNASQQKKLKPGKKEDATKK